MVVDTDRGSQITELISIIVPVYNREQFLNETLISIQHQTYSNWEAIIVDDGSSDSSIEIIQDFLLKDNRFKFFERNRNPKGAQTCRNIGMDEARGKYLMFLDSDDLLTPYCILTRITFMEENPALDFSVFPVITFEKQPGDINVLWNIFNEQDDLYRFYRMDVPWQTSSPIYNRVFADRLRWDENCISGQDWDYHVRALSLRPNYIKKDIIPDCFIRRDYTVERISRNFFKGPQILNREIMFSKNCKILKEKKMWKKEYNFPFASFYFRSSEYFLLKIKNYEFNVWKFYRNVYYHNLLNTITFLWTSLYLMGLYWLRNHKYRRNQFQELFSSLIPDSLSSRKYSTTQENLKLEGQKLEEFLKEINLHSYYS